MKGGEGLEEAVCRELGLTIVGVGTEEVDTDNLEDLEGVREELAQLEGLGVIVSDLEVAADLEGEILVDPVFVEEGEEV